MVEINPQTLLEHKLSWDKYNDTCAEEALAEGLPTFASMFLKEPVDPSAGWPRKSQY